MRGDLSITENLKDHRGSRWLEITRADMTVKESPEGGGLNASCWSWSVLPNQAPGQL